MNYFYRTVVIILSLGLVSACNGNGGSLTANKVEEINEFTLVAQRELDTHQEFDIRYPTEDTTLSGTLYLPKGAGPFPVLLFHFGSNAWERANTPVGYPSNLYHEMNVGLFFYDRRGTGDSGGICCDADIELLASDVIAGVEALGNIPQVDRAKIGTFGFSQGGWVVTNAAARSTSIAFTIVGSGSGISMDEEDLYSKLTGDDDCTDYGMSAEQIDEIMMAAEPGGYDPRQDLEQMTQPAYWYYGENDTSHPVRQVLSNLNEIKQVIAKNWHIEWFENANHEFFLGAGACVTEGEQADTFTPISLWLAVTLEEL